MYVYGEMFFTFWNLDILIFQRGAEAPNWIVGLIEWVLTNWEEKKKEFSVLSDT